MALFITTGGIMARLGCLLETLSMIALFMLVVLPVLPFFEDSEFFDNLLKPVLCPDGDIRREQYQTTDSEGTGYNMNVYCEDNEGDEVDITWQWFSIGVGGFLIPFLIGLFMMIGGFNKGMRGMMGSVPGIQGYDSYSSGLPANFGASFSSPMQANAAGKTLSQKLQELEDAKRQGLINELEYQKAREEILNG
jgi:hypothetical protein